MHSKMRLLWCEVLVKGTLAARRFQKNTAMLAASLVRDRQVTSKELAVPVRGAAQSLPKNSYSHNDVLERLEIKEQRLLLAFVPFCIGIACTSNTGALAATQTALPETVEGSVDQVSKIKLPLETLSSSPQSLGQNSFGATPQPQVTEGSRSNLFHEVILQAQNPPTPPPGPPSIPPENLQPNPNQDRFLQPPERPVPDPLVPEQPAEAPLTPQQPPQPPQPPASPDSPAVQVQQIQVTGSTVFDNDQLNTITQPYEGQTLTLEQLRQVADAITQLYLERGYITSRAIVVDQEITNGVVEIRVLEGSLQEIQIEGTRRLNPNYVRSRVRLGAGTPLNTAALEDQLRLLRADPLFENVEASLRAGTQTGQSILIVRVVEADPLEGSVGIDNYSPPSVGSERLGLNLLYRNLTGNGDTVAGSYYHTTRDGADSFEFTYRFPVNPMNGALQLRTAINRNQVVDDEFSFLNIEGDSELYEISFEQPLVRSPREEFSLSLGFTLQESQSLIGGGFPFPGPGADNEGISRTSVIKFGQNYLRRDIRGAWSLRSLFSLGTGWFDATINPEPEPDGRFFSWLGQVQRVQVLGNDNFLILGADIQLTPDSLLPSQQFVIGGGQSLRGYRQNIRSADNGVRFSVEDRITLERDEAGAAIFQLAPFFDAGIVWNVSDNPIPSPSQQFIAGVGMGLIWEPVSGLNLRLDYALPLVDLDDRGTNAQDEGFYFSVRYLF